MPYTTQFKRSPNSITSYSVKAITAFYQLRRTTGKTWGYSPRIVHWLYTVAIRPMLSYAAVVSWIRVDYSTVDKQLEHVQRIACLYITGAIRTTPTSALKAPYRSHWTNTTAYLPKTGSYDCMFPSQDEQTMEKRLLRTCKD